MFYQIFLSPHVKRCAVITYKCVIYEFPNELPKNLKLRISGSQEIPKKCPNCHRTIAQGPAPPPPPPTQKTPEKQKANTPRSAPPHTKTRAGPKYPKPQERPQPHTPTNPPPPNTHTHTHTNETMHNEMPPKSAKPPQSHAPRNTTFEFHKQFSADTITEQLL